MATDRRVKDPARLAAFQTLRQVSDNQAYPNLVLPKTLTQLGVSGRDADFATELTYGTCKRLGTYDQIIDQLTNRPLDAPVRDLLRLGAHQVLQMRVADHAAVDTTVDLARTEVGHKVTGLINAVLRRMQRRTLDDWIASLGAGQTPRAQLALRTHHPEWIVAAWAEVLPAAELEPALMANNQPPVTHLAIRPGLGAVSELVAAGAAAATWSPYGAVLKGDPSRLPAITSGRAGVQDVGSQLAVLALTRAELTGSPTGWWLDLCAGPGGKAALLAGLAAAEQAQLLAAELHPHRSQLVAAALTHFAANALVVTADSTAPAWPRDRFERVLVDAPCTGLGALRRRPEARWRRTSDQTAGLAALTQLQARLLHTAIDSTAAGGVTAYVTCSPHRAETTALVRQVCLARSDVALLDAPALVAAVPRAARADDDSSGTRGPYLQFWPHRHGTDAMFVALIRRSATCDTDHSRH